MGSRSFLAAALVGVVMTTAGCSRSAAEPKASVRVVFGGTIPFVDSRSSCVARVSPVVDGDPTGSVVDCPGVSGPPAEVVVPVPAGRSVVEVGQWGCPGMPGDCPGDPFDELYTDSPDERAVWTCGVEVVLAAGEDVTVEATGPTTTSALTTTASATCRQV